MVSSAKVLPIAYTSASAALLFKGLKATTKAEKAVLLATSALSLLNFGPSDNAFLASAKRAYKKTAPSSAGRAKQERQAALTWRSVIRIKIIGQVIGLVSMSCAKRSLGMMRGAAILSAGDLAFFLAGAGRAYHDDDGNWQPMSESVSTAASIIHAVMCTAALVAAPSPVDSTKFTVATGIFTFGAIGGAVEGLLLLFRKPAKIA